MEADELGANAESSVVQPAAPESITSVPKYAGGAPVYADVNTAPLQLSSESSVAKPAGPSPRVAVPQSPPQPCSESNDSYGYWYLSNDGYDSASTNAPLNSLQQKKAATQPAASSTGANPYAPPSASDSEEEWRIQHPEPFPGARVLAEQLRQKSKEEKKQRKQMQRQLRPHRQNLQLPSDCPTNTGHDHLCRASKPCKYLCRPGGCRYGCTPHLTYCHRYHRGQCTKAHCQYAHS